VPSVIVPLDMLPLTPNGKLDRGALPAPVMGGPVAGVPASELEGVVLATWRETLGVDRVGPHDNFFDIGGTSLLLIELRARLQRALGREVRTVTLFRNPTVRLFVRQLDAIPAADNGRTVRHTYAERSRRRATARKEAT
jgi:phosphopantetheine binding protein